ncbi:hypothetical protein [Methylomicrobium sp. Wu6]|uniref:hypothetical protein n=1 Tax=Methylomicrobium sp. Wu6 TaxID=3107928 RepID=UPI002DD64E93|nr:hypothetical protein [Methylomicrobium sp. Wu6]MEC4747337.1 hypothetical protein [Methylomicrobium sp. Wu6]
MRLLGAEFSLHESVQEAHLLKINHLLVKAKAVFIAETGPPKCQVHAKLMFDFVLSSLQFYKEWVDRVRQPLFPTGSRVEIRKRPTNQVGNFFEYILAKIYPRTDSPKKLACTVGIDLDRGFIAKIDIADLDATSPPRRAHLNLRGPFTAQSPFIAVLSANEGLQKITCRTRRIGRPGPLKNWTGKKPPASWRRILILRSSQAAPARPRLQA